jgi:hypothetical protein
MSSTSIITPTQLLVSFRMQVFHNGLGVDVWKVQKEPDVKMKVGQPIRFVSEMLAREVVDCEGKQIMWPRLYEGRIGGVVGWQRNWVRFLVMAAGRENFHLWVPLEWSALGLVHCLQHLWQRHHLVDDIPPVPTLTSVRNRRLETSKTIRVRKVLGAVYVNNEGTVAE